MVLYARPEIAAVRFEGGFQKVAIFHGRNQDGAPALQGIRLERVYRAGEEPGDELAEAGQIVIEWYVDYDSEHGEPVTLRLLEDEASDDEALALDMAAVLVGAIQGVGAEDDPE